MKPFQNAYDAIKRIFKGLFKKKGETSVNELGAQTGIITDETVIPGAESVDAKLAEQVEKEIAEKLKQADERAAAIVAEEMAKANAEKAKTADTADSAASKASTETTGTKPGKKPVRRKTTMTASQAASMQVAEAEAEKTNAAEAEKSDAHKAAEEFVDAVKKADDEEERAYQAELRKRAARKAKRERKENVEVTAKKITDPVTGGEMTLNALPEEALTLKKYMRVPTTGDDVLLAVNSIIKHPEAPKNIVILGHNGFGTVKVGEDFARSFYSMGLVKSDKIAKIKAKQLNKVGLEKLASLKGGCLVIENAGLVSSAKLVEVIQNSAPEVNDFVVILTGEIDSLARFFEENKEIVDSFIYLIEVHKIRERAMITLAKGYVKEKGYTADKAVYDRLKNSLASMEVGNIDRFIEQIDQLMEKCDSREKVAELDKKEILTADF